jgi:A/G-specific adenine glycosylase
MGNKTKSKLRNRQTARVVGNANSRRTILPLLGERAGVRAVVKSIVPALLSWFAINARALPWRRTCDPYAIWVSEIMLQQTQVKTVIPYWERWMRQLPTVQSVAKAKPAKLHKLWEGLGYYTRVRNLQKAAKEIVTQHDGKFPEDFDAVLALPGIGRYTAGAVCSIAFNQPSPILDGNVTRVLTRLFGIPSDPREKQTNAQLWQLAEELVATAFARETSEPNGRRATILPLLGERADVQYTNQNGCSHLNQSLMELGALICTPRSPQCEACPVQKLCVAFHENRVEELPNIGKRTASTARRFLAFVVERNGKFLVRQRPVGVVNAHLWEFPNTELGARHSGPQRAQSAARSLGFKPTASRPFCTIKHSITRYRITLEAFCARIGGTSYTSPKITRPQNSTRRGTPPSEADIGRWLRLAQLARLPFTAAHKKVLGKLGLERRAPPRPASSARKATRRNGVRRS